MIPVAAVFTMIFSLAIGIGIGLWSVERVKFKRIKRGLKYEREFHERRRLDKEAERQKRIDDGEPLGGGYPWRPH